MRRGYVHTRQDTFALVAIAILLGLFSSFLASHVPEAVMRMDDNFFGADINRVVGHMTNPAAQQSRIWVHPLFLLLTMPLGLVLMKISLSDLQACLVLVAASASGTGIFLYLTCRNLGLLVRHALLIVALFASSSTFMFWWSIPETFPFAGLSLAFLFFLASPPTPERPSWSVRDAITVIALLSFASAALFTSVIPYGPEACILSLALLLLLMKRKIPGIFQWSTAGVLTLSITMSNWCAALITTFLHRRIRDFATIAATTFLLCSALAVFQSRWVPSARIFYHSLKLSKTQGVQNELGPQKQLNIGVLEHIAFFTMVFPPPRSGVDHDKLVVASQPVQQIFSGPQRFLNVSWAVLLLLGLLGYTRPGYRAFGASLTGFLGFNWVLHSQYGDDTFLYATHFLVPLTLVPALAMTGKYRDVVAALCAIFVIAAFSENLATYLDTTRKFTEFYVTPTGSPPLSK